MEEDAQLEEDAQHELVVHEAPLDDKHNQTTPGGDAGWRWVKGVPDTFRQNGSRNNEYTRMDVRIDITHTCLVLHCFVVLEIVFITHSIRFTQCCLFLFMSHSNTRFALSLHFPAALHIHMSHAEKER